MLLRPNPQIETMWLFMPHIFAFYMFFIHTAYKLSPDEQGAIL